VNLMSGKVSKVGVRNETQTSFPVRSGTSRERTSKRRVCAPRQARRRRGLPRQRQPAHRPQADATQGVIDDLEHSRQQKRGRGLTTATGGANHRPRPRQGQFADAAGQLTARNQARCISPGVRWPARAAVASTGRGGGYQSGHTCRQKRCPECSRCSETRVESLVRWR